MSQLLRSISAWEDEIGKRIRQARKQRGLTQQELADRANVSRSAIKALESGAGSTLSTFIGVVRALDLDETLDQIFATASTISPLAMIKEAKRSRVR